MGEPVENQAPTTYGSCFFPDWDGDTGEAKNFNDGLPGAYYFSRSNRNLEAYVPGVMEFA